MDLSYIIIFIYTIIDGIIHGIGQQLVGTSLFPKDFIEHPPVAKQLGLSSGTAVEFVVKILDGAGDDASISHIEIRIPFPARFHTRQLVVQPLNLTGQGFGWHVDDHLLESLIVVERKNGDLSQSDGVAVQCEHQGIDGRHCGVDRNQPPAISYTAYPKRVGCLGRNKEIAIAVGDGATMRHLADHMGVAYGNQTIRRHDDAENRKFVVKIQSVFTLGEELQADQKKRYEE